MVGKKERKILYQDRIELNKVRKNLCDKVGKVAEKRNLALHVTCVLLCVTKIKPKNFFGSSLELSTSTFKFQVLQSICNFGAQQHFYLKNQ